MTDPIVNLWKTQQADVRAPSATELAERAVRFRKRMRVSDLIEYAAGTLVIAAFGSIAIKAADWGVRFASLMLIAGTCIVIRNLWRRRPTSDPAAMAQDACMHYRGLLVRKREALASAGRWYLAPFLPGMVVFIGAAVRAQTEVIPLATALSNGVIATAIVAAIFGLVLWLNQRAAHVIGAEIAALDAVYNPAID